MTPFDNITYLTVGMVVKVEWHAGFMHDVYPPGYAVIIATGKTNYTYMPYADIELIYVEKLAIVNHASEYYDVGYNMRVYEIDLGRALSLYMYLSAE